jgi:hypothetical protein
MNLTKGFTVVDCQSTPSGYYQIAFRNERGDTIVATQHARGGCNLYTPYTMQAELENWLWENRQIAIDSMTAMGFPELAQDVVDRSTEWYDIVVMSILDAIEMRKIRVQG